MKLASKKQTLLNQDSFFSLLKEKALEQKKKIFFLFDYDGTLVAFSDTDPLGASLGQEQKEFINQIIKAEDKNTGELYKAAIITGRCLRNLKDLLDGGLSEEITLIGTHGAEVNEEHSDSPHRKELDQIKEKFINEEHIKVEEKPISITFHYKDHPNREEFIGRLQQEAKKYQDIFRVQTGHDVFEYLPKDINKGIAVDYINEHYPDYLPVYFGDDLTDNYAFKRVNELNGISIQIGDRLQEQEADYTIESIDKLYEYLKALVF